MNINFKLKNNAKELFYNYINYDKSESSFRKSVCQKLKDTFKIEEKFKEEKIISPLKIVRVRIFRHSINYEGAYFFHRDDDGIEYMRVLSMDNFNNQYYTVNKIGIYNLDLFCKYHKLNDNSKEAIKLYIELNNGPIEYNKLLELIKNFKTKIEQ